MRGTILALAVAGALLLTGCGGGSKTGGGVAKQDPPTTPTLPTTPTPPTPTTPPTEAQRDTFMLANRGRLAQANSVRFGSVTQSNDGVSVSVTSPSRGELIFRSSAGLTVDTRTRATELRREVIPNQEFLQYIGDYTENPTIYETYDSSVPVLVRSFGVWNTAGAFYAGGIYVTPTGAGAFFDGTQFRERTPILTAEYNGRATGTYLIDVNGGGIARLLRASGRTVQFGAWDADVNLTAINGEVSGTLGNVDSESWQTYVNGVRVADELRTLTAVATLRSGTSNDGRVQGSIGLSLDGVSFATTGAWAGQSSDDGLMIAGTLNGQSRDTTGQDRLGFLGAFITENLGTSGGGPVSPEPPPEPVMPTPPPEPGL